MSLIVLALLAPALAVGPSPRMIWKPVEVAVDVDELCYPSGLRVTIAADARPDVVSVTTVVGTGAAHDAPEAPGVAHLLEHAWYRSRPDGRPVRSRLDATGAHHNAFTALDTTSFSALAPREALRELLLLEADRLADPLAGLTWEDFVAERAVVMSEHRMQTVEHPLVDLSILAGQIFPPGHAYQSFREALPHEIAQLTLDDLRARADAAYRPDATTLLITGAVTRGEVARILDEVMPEALLWAPASDGTRYESCEQREQPVAPTPTPSPRGELLTRVLPSTPSSMLVLGWLLPPAWTAGDTDLDTVTGWLETFLATAIAPSSSELLDARPMCTLFPGALGSAAVCSVRLPDVDAAPRVHRLALGALDGLRSLSHAWLHDTFEIARVEALGRLLASAEAPALGSEHAYRAAVGNHIRARFDYLPVQATGAVESGGSSASELGRTWLRPELMHAAVVAPGPWPTSTAPPETPAAPVPQLRTAPPPADPMDHVAVAEAAIQARLGAIHRVQLDNGLRVVILPWGTTPLVRASLVLAGGPSEEPAPGIAALADQLRVADTRVNVQAMPGAGAAIGARAIGGAWTQRFADDWRSEDLRASAGNLDELLWLVRHVVHESQIRVDASARDALVASNTTRIDWRLEDPHGAGWWASRAFRRALWGPSHPAALTPDEGAWWALGDFRAGLLQAWFRAQLQPSQATLYLVGKLDPEQAEALVRRHFGSWKDTGAREEESPVRGAPPKPPRRILVVPDAETHSAEVEVGCRVSPPASPAERAVAISLLQLLAEEALRQASDVAAYDPHASVSRERSGAAVATISVTVEPGLAGVAATRALDQLGKVAAGVPAALVDEARTVNARGEATSWVTTGQVLARLTEEGGPYARLEGLERFGADLRAVDSAQLARQFADCPGHEVVVVRGPAAATMDALRQAGLGPATVDIAAEHEALRYRRE